MDVRVSIDEHEYTTLQREDLENMFSIYEDQRNRNLFNLNESIYLNIPERFIQYHMLKHNMFWTTISYHLYGTTRLAWLLMKLNKVGRDEIFDIIKSGDSVKYISTDTLEMILSQLQEVDE